MTALFRLAARNLLRNKVRSLLTIGAIGSGMAVFMFLITLTTGQYQDMIRVAVSQQAGHLVVQAPNWQDEREPTLLVSQSAEIDAAIAERAPEATVTQRILLGGSVMSSQNTAIAQLAGIEPEDEAQVTEFDDRLVDGEWLKPEDTRGLIIGRDMADRLDAEVGDKLVFMTQQKGQTETQSRLFRVRGIFRTGASSLDGFFVIGHLDATRELLLTEDGANQISAHLPDAEQADTLTPLVQDALADRNLDIRHWREAVPDIMGMIAVDRQSNDMVMFIIGFVVALGVLNAILMSTLERTREFGVLMAIGMPALRVAALVICEGFLLGVLGVLFGIALGYGPALYLIETGLDFRDVMGETVETSGIAISALIKGAWDWPRIGSYALGMIFFTAIAATWPAWRVSRLTPVDAMRHH